MQLTKLKHFQQLLLKQRPHLRQEIEQRVQAIPEDVNPVGNVGTEPSEALDNVLAVEQVQEQLYERINSALFRIDEGTYGSCLACGRDIAESRLDALPYAEYCIDCERRHEAG